MKRTLIEIYALAVCFFTVVCLVIALGVGSWDLVQIANPEFTINSKTYENHLDNDSYLNRSCHACKEKLDGEKDLTAEQVTKERQESWQRSLNIEVRSATQSFFRLLIIIILDIILFSSHWFLAKKNSEQHG
ncbi:hypothetical protein Y017_14430 [Alcanivorax sp. 97CO-5]|uniref:hypothetical protein n=1 Tax=unclassified Alcanivorax TaxID=2638842 RepID=UPI0003E7D718|nr:MULTISPECIES: hypothetical protein [unclassified Alcanivorax]EUC69625.1 hypothetical protein Y017_14430 [Alcanivorax sp. 97CO-5]PKG01517.1 hypothetical protein Y019_09290 [Alcanivorax sp. 97CO-6]